MRRRRAALLLGLAVLGLAGIAAADRLLPPDLSRLRATSTVIADRHGEELRILATADGAWRQSVGAAEVDPMYLRLLQATEDQRFGWHPGVDPLAVGRAALQWARSGAVVSGASTLTMQTARLLMPRPRTLAGKAGEMARALQLQARLGRVGVLNAYLTLAPMGGNIEGVAAGARAWFGRTPAQLSVAEAALLVALPQSPERLRPDRHPIAARAARDRILDIAAARGIVATDIARAAKAEPVPQVRRDMPAHAVHVADDMVRTGATGRHTTTLDARLQKQAEFIARSAALAAGPDTEVAVMVVEVPGREVRALVGGANAFATGGGLDLSRAVRSPGSTLKPFIYALAFDDLAAQPDTLIDDRPMLFGGWAPRNFDGDFAGMVTLREALQRSLNIPAVALLDKVGPQRFAAVLAGTGARLHLPAGTAAGLPIALGGGGISLRDLVMLYAALADEGRQQALAFSDGGTNPAQRLFSAQSARQVTDILRDAPPPDGFLPGGAGRQVAFKTGTSYGYRDAWAIGYTKGHVVGVWMGRPDGTPRPGRMGRADAAPILFRVLDLLPTQAWPLLQREMTTRLRPVIAPPVARRDDRPVIVFPPDGATLDAGQRMIPLRARGGEGPLQWIVNGMPLGDAQTWQPDGPGEVRIVVVDAAGRQAAADVALRPLR